MVYLLQKRAAALKPVPRTGYDGEMVSMAQNGIENVSISENEKVGSPSALLQMETASTFFGSEDGIKSPSGVRNQQESTFSISGNDQRKFSA